jgi:hypothetical protein
MRCVVSCRRPVPVLLLRRRRLEVLARIGTFPVAASAGGGSTGARLVLRPLDGEFAALLSAVGPAMVAPDLSVVLAKSGQAQVSVRTAADHGHAGQQFEFALATAGGSFTASLVHSSYSAVAESITSNAVPAASLGAWGPPGGAQRRNFPKYRSTARPAGSNAATRQSR